MSFDDWLVELGNLARKEECSDYVGWTGVECWRDAYDDGLTPAEAWRQEKEAGYDLGG